MILHAAACMRRIKNDVFDRVVEEKYNGTVKYRYVYNGEGDLAKKIEVQRSGLSEKEVNVVNYEYDSLDRLIHNV